MAKFRVKLERILPPDEDNKYEHYYAEYEQVIEIADDYETESSYIKSIVSAVNGMD